MKSIFLKIASIILVSLFIFSCEEDKLQNDANLNNLTNENSVNLSFIAKSAKLFEISLEKDIIRPTNNIVRKTNLNAGDKVKIYLHKADSRGRIPENIDVDLIIRKDNGDITIAYANILKNTNVTKINNNNIKADGYVEVTIPLSVKSGTYFFLAADTEAPNFVATTKPTFGSFIKRGNKYYLNVDITSFDEINITGITIDPFDISMGATNVDSGRPYVFGKGNDGNLWNKWWSGSKWNLSNQGKPRTNISQSIGAITVDGSRPYVFVKGTDGNLWLNWWSGSKWSWSNQGKPRTNISQPMGAITVDGSRPYVFVKGTDGNLWNNWWSGSKWSWSNQGKPRTNISQSMGAITVDGSRPYVFVKGTDGNLWLNWWSGSRWSWSNQGKPRTNITISKAMGSITVDKGRPYVFVKGSDGNLWVNSWSGSKWSWSKI